MQEHVCGVRSCLVCTPAAPAALGDDFLQREALSTAYVDGTVAAQNLGDHSTLFANGSATCGVVRVVGASGPVDASAGVGASSVGASDAVGDSGRVGASPGAPTRSSAASRRRGLRERKLLYSLGGKVGNRLVADPLACYMFVPRIDAGQRLNFITDIVDLEVTLGHVPEAEVIVIASQVAELLIQVKAGAEFGVLDCNDCSLDTPSFGPADGVEPLFGFMLPDSIGSQLHVSPVVAFSCLETFEGDLWLASSLVGQDLEDAHVLSDLVCRNPSSWKRSASATLKWVQCLPSYADLIDELAVGNLECLRWALCFVSMLNRLEWLDVCSKSEFAERARDELDGWT